MFSTGLLVAQLTPGGAGEKAGLQAATIVRQRRSFLVQGGDVIVAVEGHPVATRSDLLVYLEDNHQPGDTVTLTINRGGRALDVPITLSAAAQTP